MKKSIVFNLFKHFFSFSLAISMQNIPFRGLAQEIPLSSNNKISSNQLIMQGILANLKPKADFEKMFFLANNKGVVYYQNKLDNLKPEDNGFLLKYNLAEQLLLAGKSEASIKLLEETMPIALEKEKKTFLPGNYSKMQRLLAMAYFRVGEQENCILNHNSESCIYPIKGQGLYKIKEPTQHAIKIFKDILNQNPRDYESMWVMNVAYMNLGLYPDSVPLKYFVPSNTFDETTGTVKFKDIASLIGVKTLGLAGSVSMEDFDNDGDIDLFITSEDYDTPLRYFVNEGDQGFVEKTESAGLAAELGGRICQHADYNNDGFVDVFVIRGGWQTQENNLPPNSLLKNNGDGTFTDVTIESGLLTFMATSSAAWADYDNDGWLDVFLSVETQNAELPHPCRLYHNNHDGSFAEVSQSVGLNIMGFMKGCMWTDYNRDGYQDIYVTNFSGDNFLLKNNKGKDGRFFFTDVTQAAGVNDPKSGISCMIFDYNNDGWPDIFASASTLGVNNDAVVLNYMGRESVPGSFPRFYKNNKDGTFLDATKEVGLNRAIYGMGMNFGDIDNDGYLDMYIGTGFLDYRAIYPNLMFRNDEGKRFQDVTNETGTGNLQKGHGVGFGDIDNDGDQDVFEVMGGGYTGDLYQNVIYENQGNLNHWVKLKLFGVKSNKSAIGSEIKITVETASGTRDIYNTLSTGGPFGASPLMREIGIGNALSIKKIEIFWPASQIRQVFKDVKMNEYYEITEGVNKLVTKKLKKITFVKNLEKEHNNHVK